MVTIFTKALFPTDFSDASERALLFATGLKALGLEHIVIVNVLDTRGLESPVVTQKEKITRLQLEHLAERAREHGVEVTPKVLYGGAANAILEAAVKEDVDLIVTGSHGKRAIDEVLLGSVSEKVGRESDVPVLIIRYGLVEDRDVEELVAEAERICAHVIHPTDFSDYSNKALSLVCDLKNECSAASDSTIAVIHVIDGDLDDEKKEIMKRDGRAKLKKVKNKLDKAKIKAETKLVVGDPVAETLRIAGEEGATLIVLGSHGKGIVSETIVGSVSQNVIRMANKPVLVTR